VDAPEIVRTVVNFKRLTLTDIKIDVRRLAKKKELKEAIEAGGKKARLPPVHQLRAGFTAVSRKLSCWRMWTPCATVEGPHLNIWGLVNFVYLTTCRLFSTQEAKRLELAPTHNFGRVLGHTLQEPGRFETCRASFLFRA
jgi:hypothetical protein